MKRIVLFVIACMVAFVSQAQMSGLLYNSKHIPQINAMNPAFFTNSKFYLSLPNVNLNFSSPLAFSDLYRVEPDANGQNITYIDTKGILENLDNLNEINADLNVGLFGFGFRTKNGFVSFSSQLRNNIQLGVPKDILHFLIEGNVTEEGKGRDLTLLDQDLLSFTSYLEFGLGVGREFGEKLTVGLRGKFLMGLANINTNNTAISLYTDPDLNSLTVDMDYHVRMSAPVPIGQLLNGGKLDMSTINYLPQNFGVAFDVGAKYEINDKFSVAASVLDVGAIHWVENPVELHPKDNSGSFTFSGLEWESMFGEGEYNEDFFSKLVDSIVNELTQYDIDTLTADYWEMIPWRFNLSATYDLNKIISGTLMYRGEKNKFSYFQSLTAGININLWDWLEIMACNSVHNFNDWLNPGVGISLSLLKTLQVYTLFDYVSDLYLVDGKSFRFFFGLNIAIGTHKD